MLKFFLADVLFLTLELGWKNWIRDKHPGSETHARLLDYLLSSNLELSKESYEY
jgi:hypothetical protein